ncbi:MAG: FAD-dependent oxidoreductase [Thermomicrobiales bacterium]
MTTNEHEANLTVYGAPWCPDCRRAKQFLGEHRVAYQWVDVDADPASVRRIEELNDGKHSIPVILFADQSILVEPTNAALAAKLGLQTQATQQFYDLVVVGGGPAGITAAIYAAREGISTLVVERSSLGGQAAITERLDNYPGFPDGVTGEEFRTRLVAHARRFGVELLSAQEVTDIGTDGAYRCLALADGTTLTANAVLLAPGSTYRRLGVPGEQDFLGAGVHFCATCDGPFYRGQEVLVIGGGNSAGEESLFLTRFASHVTILVRGDGLSASAVVREKVAECDTITVRPHTAVEEFAGAHNHLTTVRVRDTGSGATETLHPAGVFVFIGLRPNTAFLRGIVRLDDSGFIVTDAGLQTSVPGLFAAGDARVGSTKQVASAAGEGAAAALAIRAYLQRFGEEGRVMHEPDTMTAAE